MIAVTEKNHVLEYRRRVAGSWGCWLRVSAFDEHLRPAIKLSLAGRIIDALELAYDASNRCQGNCHDVEFRVVTTTTEVTVLGGEWAEDRLRVKP